MIHRFRHLCVLSVLFASVFPAQANEPYRPEKISVYPDPKPQKHYRIKNARVVWVDFDRMRADFPQIAGLKNHEIEEFILDQYARVSETQLRLRGIRVSEFEVTDARTFYQPTDYHRAAIAPTVYNGQQIGFMDLKGTGLREPDEADAAVKAFREARSQDEINQLRIKDHSDGAATLGEVIAEVTKQRAVQAGFDLGYAKGETVECYFVIDTGFDILKENDGRVPAGIIGRQAHLRGNNYGVEYSKVYDDPEGGFQRSLSGASVDFGGVIVTLPEVRENYSVRPGGNPLSAQDMKSWAYGHETALAFRRKADENLLEARGYVYRHIDDMLGSLAARWRKKRILNKPRIRTPEQIIAAIENDGISVGRKGGIVAVASFIRDVEHIERIFPDRSRQLVQGFFDRHMTTVMRKYELRSTRKTAEFIQVLGDLHLPDERAIIQNVIELARLVDEIDEKTGEALMKILAGKTSVSKVERIRLVGDLIRKGVTYRIVEFAYREGLKSAFLDSVLRQAMVESEKVTPETRGELVKALKARAAEKPNFEACALLIE